MIISLRNNGTHIGKYLFTLIMLFTLAGLLLSSFVMTGGCDFITGADNSTQLMDDENGKSFIWKISSGNSFVFLLGSIHLGTPDTYPLDRDKENAFEISDKLVVESNVNEISPLKSLLLLEKYGTYPAGEGLRENLPQQLFVKLTNLFWESGIGISTLNDYRPWVIYTMLDGLIIEENEYSIEYGIDMHFLNRATARGIEILELEEVEYTFELLSSLPDELMVQVLEMSIEEPFTVEDIDAMVRVWEEGSAEGMAELVFRDLGEEPALVPFYEVLFDQRNHNMMVKIEEFLADKYTYFIVVGAGHLVGEEGVINLLDEAGYTIEQL